MWGTGSILAFLLALIFNLAGLSKGHLTWQMFALAGLLLLAVHIVSCSPWPWKRG